MTEPYDTDLVRRADSLMRGHRRSFVARPAPVLDALPSPATAGLPSPSPNQEAELPVLTEEVILPPAEARRAQDQAALDAAVAKATAAQQERLTTALESELPQIIARLLDALSDDLMGTLRETLEARLELQRPTLHMALRQEIGTLVERVLEQPPSPDAMPSATDSDITPPQDPSLYA